MTEIILDWNKYILTVDEAVYKNFQVDCGTREDISLCKIYVIGEDGIYTTTIKYEDIVFIESEVE